MATLRKKLGLRIRRFRKERKWTQGRLAQETSLSLEQISCVERATRSPSLEAIERIARAFRIPVAELFRFSTYERIYEADREGRKVMETAVEYLRTKKPARVRRFLDAAMALLGEE